MLALLPIKALDSAKQRLSGILDKSARRQLSEAMLRDVLTALDAQPVIERIVICAADSAVERIAYEHGARYINETSLNATGLNGVVNAASRHFKHEGIQRMMVVHGDLPMLCAKELGIFVENHIAGGVNAVTLVPDTRRDGTNLLAWNPASRFEAQYGPQSFTRHCQQCDQLGVEPTVCVLPTASRDIDHADDLVWLASPAAHVGPHTGEWLQRVGPMVRLQTGSRHLATRSGVMNT